jgi:penicillin-binding protein 1C
MQQLAIWPEERVKDALAEPIFSMQQQSPMLAPLLARRLKNACSDCEKISTLIDIETQRQLEALVADYASQLEEGLSVGVLVMENENGAVRSYIGSADIFDDNRAGHVDMVQAVRSPGSTLKPFLYGLAIDQGLVHSQSLLQDTPRYKKAYRPKNFSGGFNGPVSVTQALQRSLNIPAVQVLEQLQPEYFAAKLRSSGLKLYGAGATKPNVSMILGGVGTKLEHLVGAYSALARAGKTIKPRLTDQEPKVERYLLSEGAAWITWKMLAVDPLQKSYKQVLDSDWQLAWKTGTSYGYREAWAMGVNSKWSIGVWVGRPDGGASPGLSGRKTAAPLLFKVARALGAQQALRQPNSVSAENICWPHGGALSSRSNSESNCQRQLSAWVLDGTVPKTMSEQSLTMKVWYNAKGERVTPRCERGQLRSADLVLWPVALEPWLSQRQRRSGLLEEMSPACQAVNQKVVEIKITSVADNSFYQFDGHGLSLQLLAQGGNGERAWYLNGKYLATSAANQAQDLKIEQRGKYQLSVLDERGNSDVINFSLQ